MPHETTRRRSGLATRADELRQDVRYALRALRQRAGFASAVVLTLALGIGAATAMFTVLDGVLVKPLPVRDEGSVVVAWKAARGYEHVPFSYPAYEQLRARLSTASDVATHPYSGASRVAAEVRGQSLAVRFTPVSGNLFELLGARAAAGRLLTPSDDHEGAAPVIVIGHGLWQRAFGGERDIIGAPMRVGGVTYTIVGVAPPHFDYPGRAEAWAPILLAYPTGPGSPTPLRASTGVFLDLVIRLAPGATPDLARAELQRLVGTFDERMATALGEQVVRAQVLSDVVTGDVRPALLLLGAAVLVLLIVAGVNVANLLLARGLVRRRELTVRAALGAGRGRLVRQLATESLVLAAAACALGLVVAHIALGALLTLAPAELPRLDVIAIDWRAAAFAALAAIAAALLFGVLPALRTSRIEEGAVLRARDDIADRGVRGYRLRHALVIGQIALTALVLCTAGLLVRSFAALQALDVGFAADELALVELELETSRYPEHAQHQQRMAQLADAAAALPGVTAASAVLTAPFAGTSGFDIMVYPEGMGAERAAALPFLNYEGADAAHFDALRLPLVRGRGIEPTDDADAARVVVINETAAQLLWPGEDPVGGRVKWGTPESPDEWRTVVGVAADTRYREYTEPRPTVFVPYGQGIPVRPRYLAVRTTLGAGALQQPIRQLLQAEEPGAAIVGIAPMRQLLDAPLARPRFQSALTGAFAALGLLLSVIGTYGVLAFFVRQRTREIGIRMALGAHAGAIRRHVLVHGLIMGGIGVALGLAAALAAGRALRSLLYGVAATDALVYAVTAGALLAATLAAAWLPARHALRTDPAQVIRTD